MMTVRVQLAPGKVGICCTPDDSDTLSARISLPIRRRKVKSGDQVSLLHQSYKFKAQVQKPQRGSAA